MKALRAVVQRWARVGWPWRAAAPVLWAAMIWLLSARPITDGPVSAWRPFVHNGAHVVVYAVLGGLALLACASLGRAAPAVAWLLSALYGVADELHQSTVATRVASLGDVCSDAAGAVLGVAFTLWLWREERCAVRVAWAVLPVALLCVAVETWG